MQNRIVRYSLVMVSLRFLLSQPLGNHAAATCKQTPATITCYPLNQTPLAACNPRAPSAAASVLMYPGRAFGRTYSNDNCAEHVAENVITDRVVECHGAGGIDAACDRIIEQFGAARIEPDLIARIEHLTGIPAHPFLSSGLVCAHRDLDLICDAYERGEPFYLYTGRGPSAGCHLGRPHFPSPVLICVCVQVTWSRFTSLHTFSAHLALPVSSSLPMMRNSSTIRDSHSTSVLS